MKKVIVIGCPGSGKSTFSRALHEKTGLPLVHLDLLNWNADRTTVPREVFRQRLADAMQGARWIIDGNYASTMELRIAACDTVIFLDYPTQVCLDGIRARRGTVRTDLPWVETEEMPEDEEFVAFVRGFETDSRPQVVALLKQYADKNVIRFTDREQANEFLKTLQEE